MYVPNKFFVSLSQLFNIYTCVSLNCTITLHYIQMQHSPVKLTKLPTVFVIFNSFLYVGNGRLLYTNSYVW